MAKKIASIEEQKIEEVISETEVNPINELPVSEEMPKIYIPDVPSQIIEVKKQDDSVPEEPKGETEIEFLQRIMFIQEDGGFGRHLHQIILNRIKSLS